MTQNDHRADPDRPSARTQTGTKRLAQGKLKIFLGYVAGVGKTWAMLEAAHQRKAEGVDVIIGHVDVHERPETQRWLETLETIPQSPTSAAKPEINLAGILKRRPKLVLIDDLAHTNLRGAHHRKRYQDVEELCEAGIDVYTTLNIQNLESANESIKHLTGITVSETIPDRVLEEADDIELVDLPPDELLQRFREGKVDLAQHGAKATKLFQKKTLTALRELAMRYAAQRAIDQTRAYMQPTSASSYQEIPEHLLVYIGPGTSGERLVRTTRYLARALHAEWSALYVETPQHSRLSEAQRDQISHTLRLAESLGGRIIKLPGTSVAKTVIDFAKSHNMTKVIVGKPLHPRWKEWLHSTLADELVRSSGDIDIYIISSTHAELQLPRTLQNLQPHSPWGRYLKSMGLVIISTLINIAIQPVISPTNLAMIYLISVILAAVYLGRGPAILASFSSVIAFDFFFIPPGRTLEIEDTEFLLTFLALLGVGLIISTLTAQVREQIEGAQRREVETMALYALSQDMAAAEGLNAIVHAIVANIKQTFGWESTILLPKSETKDTLNIHPSNQAFPLSDQDLEAALWAYHHTQYTGQGTNTYPESQAYYLPLKTAHGTVGVLGIQVPPQHDLTAEQRRLLKGFALQGALALERAQLAEAARRTQLLEATERLQTALLNSISHDLRTPLVSITGVLSSLEDEETPLNAETRRSLVETAREEADRLNRIVGNLLNMTRIEGGAMHIIWEPGDVQDVIGSALEQLKRQLKDRPVTVKVPQDLPLVPMGFVFIVLVLVNVIENAIKYSPPGSPIEIQARVKDEAIEIQVSDHGIGIPPEDLEHIFDKFYRVQRPNNVSGTGLGLSIAKGITEAHGGHIWAENRPEGGTTITLTLPREQHNHV